MLGIAMPYVRSGKFSDPSPAIAFPTNWIFSKPFIPLRLAVPLKWNCIFFFLCAACVRSSISSPLNDNGFRFSAFFPRVRSSVGSTQIKTSFGASLTLPFENERWGSLQHREEIERDKSNERTEREREQTTRQRIWFGEEARPAEHAMWNETRRRMKKKKTIHFVVEIVALLAESSDSEWCARAHCHTLNLHAIRMRALHFCVFIFSVRISLSIRTEYRSLR